MRVTIASNEKTEPYTDSNGRPASARYQDAYLHEPGKPYPTSCKLPLYEAARAYAPGEYETGQDLEINNFGKLRVRSEIALRPVAAAAAKS